MWLDCEGSTHLPMFHPLASILENETKLNKTKDFDFSQLHSVLYQHRSGHAVRGSRA